MGRRVGWGQSSHTLATTHGQAPLPGRLRHESGPGGSPAARPVSARGSPRTCGAGCIARRERGGGAALDLAPLRAAGSVFHEGDTPELFMGPQRLIAKTKMKF